ncbi:DUF397 domain-containing protein [Actinoplanes sp. NPDC051861]|uniref:DUF397 domain-containing protein n=1 Tax=Actinoplanes sp. NPDC051861 TaxID=3155170 RepID=UPI003417DC6B
MSNAVLYWRRSSFCADGACVEAAADGDDVLVRDSKNLDQPHLRFRKPDWNEFLDGIAGTGGRPSF